MMKKMIKRKQMSMSGTGFSFPEKTLTEVWNFMLLSLFFFCF